MTSSVMKKRLVAHNEAIRINPHSAQVYCNMGDAFTGLGLRRYPEAIEAYKKAICLWWSKVFLGSQ